MGKVRFQVLSCTGEDPAGPASLLNEHDQTGVGYLTPKHCDYPQEIVLELEGVCRITQIQVLSHQSHIATKIELFLSQDLTSFTRLGYLGLKSNKESQYTARELKTVHIDAVARYVKFRLHQCYVNEKNLYSQVGIVAINVNGEVEAQEENEAELESMSHVHQTLPPTPGRSKAQVMTPTKQLNDLDLRFDPKTAARIREIHAAKEKAVAMEDYDQAKRLKVLEEQLKNVGLQLARLEAAKKEAAANEDYDEAKRIKEEITRLEASIGSDSPDALPATQSQPRSFPGENRLQKVKEPVLHNIPPAVPSIPKPRRVERESDNVESNVMERPLSSQQRRSFAPPDEEEDMDAPVGQAPSNERQEGLPDCEHLADPEPIPDSLAKESAEMIGVVGDYLTCCFYSNLWNHRDAAMRKVKLQIEEGAFDDVDPHAVLAVASTMVQSGVGDRISQVSLSAIALCEAMLNFAEVHQLDSESIVSVMNSPLVQLVNKLGEPQTKLREEVTVLLLKMAESEVVGASVIASHIFRRSSKKALPLKSLQGRLGVVKALLSQSGLVPELTLETVMGFLEENSAFSHQSKDIRELAKAISVVIYQNVGGEITPFLKSLRPKQMEEYQAAFEGALNATKKTRKAAPAPAGPPRKVEEPIAVQQADEYDEETDSNASVEEFTCSFCDRHDASFDSDRLDQHYWAECPMLTQCKMCSQVIEICTLNEHLLDECDQKHNHRACPRCGEAITIQFFEKHTSMNDCEPMPSPDRGNRCPLCHEDIGPRKRGWKAHLLQSRCPNNPRSLS
ncbi:hypothetical protein LEN26_000583 [Aphanomyces euteiches]|nr:hypothetical protein AeMF1_002892 [Aphanomyces euteiches]KAH9163258.1 hypothetical protein LEN26_000583 [Aphanomyces euteiches]KAH9189723.1 hypothetical protein AeNC1_008302 [Aphanomyces euteiches]